MKRDDFLRAVGDIGDDFIDEAAPVRKKRLIGWQKFAAIAACIAIVFSAIGLYLFLPGDTFDPSVSKYADSEYYQIISRIDKFYRKNSSTNFDHLFGAMGGDIIEEGTPTDSPDADDGYAVDVTDNQVAGVDESDLIKRSKTHIYYLHLDTLYVYSIKGEGSRLVGSYVIPKEDDAKYSYNQRYEMYLSDDASTVTLIAPYLSKDHGAATAIISIDVSTPTSIGERSRVCVYGSYLSSRVTGGRLLVISSYRPSDPDYDKPETFVPKIDTGTGIEAISPDSIVYPDELSSSMYTVVTSLDASTLSHGGTCAFLSYSEQLYVSDNAVYATRGYVDEQPDGDARIYTRKTDISKLSYASDELEYCGTFTVDGYVKDQYSLDECDGVMRIVTTTESWGNGTSLEPGGTNASLYCLDASTFEILAEVKNFAPWGETVRSVRFDGDAAYVCTSIQLSDPVFFFDLSDLSNITCTDTGTIEGFSTSLINFGNGYLIGIGVGGVSGSLKVEVYTEVGDKVIPLCSYELPDTYYSIDYKSYYVDRENQLIGLGVINYSGGKFTDTGDRGYILLSFDGYALCELMAVGIDCEPAQMRGVFVDGFLYVLGADDMVVKKIS